MKRMGSPPVIRLCRHPVLAALLAVAASQTAVAQRLLCAPIRPDETAAQVAKRITGDSTNTKEPWFQIVNPRTSVFLAKSNYGHLPAGWRACVVNEPAAGTSPTANGAPDGVGHRLRLAMDRTAALAESIDLDLALWGTLLVSIALMSHNAEQYFKHRASVVAAMRRFGESFVHEFERPLLHPDRPDRPIQSRLRFTPRHARLDVFLAPAAGRRYPNLTDHRKNVEYDVTRVLDLLEDQPFVSGSPYASGRWIVVPFQLKVGITEAGGK